MHKHRSQDPLELLKTSSTISDALHPDEWMEKVRSAWLAAAQNIQHDHVEFGGAAVLGGNAKERGLADAGSGGMTEVDRMRQRIDQAAAARPLVLQEQRRKVDA